MHANLRVEYVEEYYFQIKIPKFIKLKVNLVAYGSAVG
jgi:hypothetical protein